LSRARQQTLEELERERARLTALETLEQQDWDAAFTALRATKDRLLEELREQSGGQLESACREQLTEWMESDESWNDLLEQRLDRQLGEESSRQSEQLLEQLRAELEGGDAGAELSSTQREAFRDAGLRVEEVLSGCLREFGAATQAGTPRLAVNSREIPVARGLADYLLLRTGGRLRQEVFGNDGSRNVASTVKNRRLRESSLEKIRATVRDTVDREMPELQQRYADELVDSHASRCIEALTQSISESRVRLQDWIGSAESRLRLHQQAQEVLERIQNSCARFDRELSELQTQFNLDPASTSYDVDEVEIEDAFQND